MVSLWVPLANVLTICKSLTAVRSETIHRQHVEEASPILACLHVWQHREAHDQHYSGMDSVCMSLDAL